MSGTIFACLAPAGQKRTIEELSSSQMLVFRYLLNKKIFTHYHAIAGLSQTPKEANQFAGLHK